MCYLIAKDVDKIGCVALQTQHGTALVELQSRLLKQIGYDKIQLVTISRPSAYGEYEPYRFVKSESEFEEAVKVMAKMEKQ